MALRDHNGNTPLHLVALHYTSAALMEVEYTGAAEALLGARADPFAENSKRRSALSIACDCKNTKLQVCWRAAGKGRRLVCLYCGFVSALCLGLPEYSGGLVRQEGCGRARGIRELPLLSFACRANSQALPFN